MALLVVAAAGVAHMCGVAMQLTQGARIQTSTSVLASQKLEQLRALVWSVDANGLARSDWTSDLASDVPSSGGPGLSASPANALESSVVGSVDYLDARGSWVGAGPELPPTARFIRRWLVRPLPEDPGDTLVLQVLVTTVERERQARQPRQRLAGDALVTTVLTRHTP